MEVIYTGLRQTPEMIIEAAIQEDVDVIGISVLSGAHMTIFPRILTLMKEKGIDDILLTGGGIIPEEDIKLLKHQGVGELFTPGASTVNIANFIKTWITTHPR
jgi:methylmalonyl-CoA mutase C-terminal domain/subunit